MGAGAEGGQWTLDGGLGHPNPCHVLPFLVQDREERVPEAGASVYAPALADPPPALLPYLLEPPNLRRCPSPYHLLFCFGDREAQEKWKVRKS